MINGQEQEQNQQLILVIDDDAAMRLLMRASLEQAGLEVIEAENGEVALTMFDQKNPDLLLLDVQMPGIDGYQVCQQIRERDKGKETPVIMITGLDDDLRLNQDRLLQAQRVSRMGNWDWDIINDRLIWSRELYRIFKKSARA